MGFNKKNQGVPSVWDNIKKNSEREDAGIWAEVDFVQIIENTERLYYYARLVSGVLPEHTNLAEKIRLVWGGENWRTLVFLVKEPLVANQLRYLMNEIERRLSEKARYVPPLKVVLNPQHWGHYGIHLLVPKASIPERMSDKEANAFINNFLAAKDI